MYGLISYEPLKYEDYTYPAWANIFGMLLAASSISCIPLVAVWKLCRTPGTIAEVLIFVFLFIIASVKKKIILLMYQVNNDKNNTYANTHIYICSYIYMSTRIK